jgi:CRISPR-associated protein Cmr6
MVERPRLRRPAPNQEPSAISIPQPRPQPASVPDPSLSFWLNPNALPPISGEASFVEYLRWMRPATSAVKEITKNQMLQFATGGDYRHRCAELNRRTRLIAGKANCFLVKCPWRIRVGGSRGPEEMLLPAFDALGIPYIPSSTLRGIARTQAVHHMRTTQNLSWEKAQIAVAPWFGSLAAEANDQGGKVVFLDAYPIPETGNGGLAVDMANSIWSWEGKPLQYAPNPNVMLSLDQPTFCIGLCWRQGIAADPQLLDQVRQWLVAGLQQGAGAQVNSGYGRLLVPHAPARAPILRLDFTLKGQLIHGGQTHPYSWRRNKKTQQWETQGRGRAVPEMRPIAFKSMLRYWFRAFALGGWSARTVKEQEAQIFGSIDPQRRGWVAVQMVNGRIIHPDARLTRNGENDPCGEAKGQFVLEFSPEIPASQEATIQTLMHSLTWLMVHLGGVGLGARRPVYRRNRAPWYRGCDLVATGNHLSDWMPPDLDRFVSAFKRQRLQMYGALSTLIGQPFRLRPGFNQNEIVDDQCAIVAVSGPEHGTKPFALDVLHHQFHQLEQTNRRNAGNLCGTTFTNPVKPSPVWVRNLGEYQVVTVFGAKKSPRRDYLTNLQAQGTQYRPL